MIDKEIEFQLPVDPDKVSEFAVAVGEDNQIYHDPAVARQLGMPGPVAPPTFSVTQILDYARVLHGEQEFVYRRLPLAGETLTGTMRISKDFSKEGKRGGTMRFVTYETTFTDADGEEVLSAYYTLIQTAKDPSS